MVDLALQFGGDLAVGPTGDLELADGSVLTQQRVLRRLLTNPGESTRLLVDVENTGARAGDETVQMYIRDRVSSVTRPIKELKGFERITLQPGEKTTVTLPITPDRLAFWDVHTKFTVEPGAFAGRQALRRA